VVRYHGRSWSAPKLIDSKAQLWSVSCPARRYCAAVDIAGNVLTYNGTSWRTGHLLRTGGSGLQSVSCPVAGLCVAVSYGGGVFTLSKGTWSRTGKITSSQKVTTVSCYSISFCAAVAQGGDAIIGH
jgi:hypothetical protein